MDASLGVSWSVVPEKNFNALIEQFKGKCHSWVRPLVLLIAIHDDLSTIMAKMLFPKGGCYRGVPL